MHDDVFQDFGSGIGLRDQFRIDRANATIPNIRWHITLDGRHHEPSVRRTHLQTPFTRPLWCVRGRRILGVGKFSFAAALPLVTPLRAASRRGLMWMIGMSQTRICSWNAGAS